MADYFTNDEELTAVADAIREKTGGTDPLRYEDGFVGAIRGIQTAQEAINDNVIGVNTTWSSSKINTELGTKLDPTKLAPDYSTLTFPVAYGTYCVHNAGLYKASQDIPTAEAWTSGHWTSVNVMVETGQAVLYRPQALSTAQKMQATTNIGALNTEWGQTLTDDQKQAVRSKIGLPLIDWDANWTEAQKKIARDNLGVAKGGLDEDLTAGTAMDVIGDPSETDTELYTYRKTGGDTEAGNRERLNKIVGGTVAWNQLVNPEWLKNTTYGGVTVAASGHSLTISGTATLNESFSIMTSRKEVNIGDKMLLVGSKPGVNIRLGQSTTVYDTGNGAIDVATTTLCGALAIRIIKNDTYDNIVITPVLFNLTQMFGSTIADAIYAMEQATAGAGVAWFRNLFPADYYAYDAGSLQSVNVAAHRLTGFNQWDEQWENGYITNGVPAPWSGRIRSKNFTQVIPGATYYVYCGANEELYVVIYDGNKNYIGQQLKRNGTFTMSERTHYIKLWIAGQSSYANDICINFSDPAKNGTYEPYAGHTYPMGNVDLRGVPSLVDGKLVYNGDEYKPDGNVTRKYGVVDLGTLNWTKNTINDIPVFYNNSIDNIAGASNASGYAVCAIYQQYIGSAQGGSDKQFVLKSSYAGSRSVLIFDSAYTDTNTFKTAMSGVMLVYELATTTTETADPYNPIQICDKAGTEEFVDRAVEAGTRDVAIPVGHETDYFESIFDTVKNAPHQVFAWYYGESSNLNIRNPEYAPDKLSIGDILVVVNEAWQSISGGTTDVPWKPFTTLKYKGTTYSVTWLGDGLPPDAFELGLTFTFVCSGDTSLEMISNGNNGRGTDKIEFTGSVSMGRRENSAIGVSSTALGRDILATGAQSHAEGWSTEATGAQAHAEGYATHATGKQAHAEGNMSFATGDSSHAEGAVTSASGGNSHAEGAMTHANAAQSHAEGYGTNANGRASHTEGLSTTASHRSQHVSGEYNVADSSTNAATERGNYAEIIGNGTGSSAKSNARTLDWDGNERLMGDLYVGCDADSSGGESLTGIVSGAIDSVGIKQTTEYPEGIKIATFEDAADGAPMALTVGVEPLQDLHGYENPWPAGGGKNLLNYSVANVSTNSTNFNNGITIKANQAYTFSYYGNSNVSIIAYYHGTSDRLFASGYTKTYTYTPTEDAEIDISFYNSSGVTSAENLFQLETGSTSTSWQPYSNICPITGWTGANVTRTGLNIWDEQWEVGGYGTGNFGKTLLIVTGNRIRSKNRIMVKPNTTYYYSGHLYIVGLYDKTSNKCVELTASASEQTSFTVPKDINYIVFCTAVDSGTAYNNNIFISPENKNIYESYKSNSYSITFPSSAGTVYGGTLSVNKDGTGSLVVDKGNITLNGSESWQAAADAYFIEDLLPTGYNLLSENDFMCNSYIPGNSISASSDISSNYDKKIFNQKGTSTSRRYRRIWIMDSAYSAVSDFKTGLEANPVQLIFTLPESAVYTITAPQIRTLLGMNNVWSNTGDLFNLEYTKDTETFIEEKVAPLETKAPVIENTASGAIATFTDGADDLPMALTVGIEPVQDLHGQEYPWPAGGGKNIFNIDGTYSVTNPTYTYRYTLEPNTQYTLSTNCPQTGDLANLYFNGSSSGSNGVKNGAPKTATTDENGKIYVAVRKTPASGQGIDLYTAVKDGTYWIQLEKGSTATDYAPYSNICPISGWTGAEVTRTGKNLFGGLALGNKIVSVVDNPSNTYLGSDDNGDYVTFSAGTALSNKPPIFTDFKPNTRYTFILRMRKEPTTSTATNLYIEYTDGTGASLGSLSGNGELQTLVYTSANNKSIANVHTAFYGGRSYLYYNESGIFEGVLTANDFEPYSGSTYPITFPSSAGTVYGGTLSINKDGTGSLSVNHIGLDMGSIPWQHNGSYNQVFSYSTSSGNYPAKVGTFVSVKGYCSIFRIETNSFNYSNLDSYSDNAIFKNSGNTVLYIKCTNCSNLTSDQFKQYVTGQTIVYELETPTTYTITAPQVRTLLGMNNVWSNTGDTTADYPADTKLYIDKALSASRNLMELIVTANREDSMKATKAYSTGNLLIVNGTLYKATTSIANGATLTVGTNVTATTVAAELAALA